MRGSKVADAWLRSQHADAHEMSSDEAIFAELTPPGRGGISTLGLLWPAGLPAERLTAIFRPSLDLSIEQLAYRHVIADDGVAIDEVVVRAERLATSTAEDGHDGAALLIEIHCHGGPASVAAIGERLQQCGSRRVGAAELVEALGRRWGLSTIEREADTLLGDLATMSAVAVVLRQREGLLARAVGEIADWLESGRDADAAARHLDELLEQWRRCGRWLLHGPRVAIVGRPNVGKSSLLNALAGHERVIVDESPGTTRDVVGEVVSLGGLAVELLDTAGLRETDEAVERAGVELALSVAMDADLRLCLVDLSQPLTAAQWRVADECRPPRLVVGTKSDLRPPDDAVRRGCDVCVSSVSGEGLEGLARAVIEKIGFAWPAEGEPVPFTPRQAAVIEVARELIRRGQGGEAAARLREM